MSDCIFCKIAEHEIPSDIVYEDDKICVYNDIAPQAPVHALMIPRKHIASLDDVTVEDQELLGYMLSTETLANDMGTILTGAEAVESGLIDALGGISDALQWLHGRIEGGNQEIM